jgi:hypothetical protein
MRRVLVSMKLIPLMLVCCALAGCSTAIALTDDGQQTRHGTQMDLPPGCRLIGELRIGIPPDAARPPTEDDFIILMRNKAGEMGGNYVIVDTKEERNAGDEEARHWIGRGRSYACPAAEEASAGGDAPREDPIEGDEGGPADEAMDEEEADDGVSDEDLLGDL